MSSHHIVFSLHKSFYSPAIFVSARGWEMTEKTLKTLEEIHQEGLLQINCFSNEWGRKFENFWFVVTLWFYVKIFKFFSFMLKDLLKIFEFYSKFSIFYRNISWNISIFLLFLFWLLPGVFLHILKWFFGFKYWNIV